MTTSILFTILLIAIWNLGFSLFFRSTNLILCGIVGFSGPLKSRFDLKKLHTLFYINSLERGLHSVGIFTPKNGISKVGESYTTMVSKEDNIIDTLIPDNQLIGHVRHATIGARTQANSHPWEYEHLIGLHNGTLKEYSYGDHSICSKYGITYKDYDVDSQVLLMALNKDIPNINTNLLPALENYEGAAALLFYSKERGTIFACHDKERPLYYGYIGKAMYISSIQHTLYIIGCTDIKEFEINHVYEIKNGVIINKFAYTPQKGIVKTVATTVKTKPSHSLELEIKISSTQLLANYTKCDTTGLLIPKDPTFIGKNNCIEFTGLHSTYDAPAELLDNFNVRFRANNKIEILDSITNKFISIDGTKDFINITGTSKFYTNHLVSGYLNGNMDKEIEIKSHLIEITNFVPLKGQYVKCIERLYYTSDKTLFATLDDILKVDEYNKYTGTFLLQTIDGTELTASVYPSQFVKATKKEVTAFAEEVMNNELYYSLTGEYLNGVVIDITGNQNNNDSCEIPVTPGENGIQTEPTIKLKDPTEIVHDDIESEEDIVDNIIEVDAEKFDEMIINIREAFTDLKLLAEEDEVDTALLVDKVKEYADMTKQINFKEIIL